MTAMNIPFLVIGIALTAPLFAFGVRRLLGLRLPLLRTLVAGVSVVLVAAPVITAIIPKNSGVLPGLWFVLLGYAIALLAGMAFLVVAETFCSFRLAAGPCVSGPRNGPVAGPGQALRADKPDSSAPGPVPLENRILALNWAFPVLRRLARTR
jgi:hypothetical protein